MLPASCTAEYVEMPPLLEHPADHIAVHGYRFFTDKAQSHLRNPVAVTVPATVHFGQGVALARVHYRFYRFSFFELGTA